MTFLIQRYHDGDLMFQMSEVEEVVAFGMMEIIWGSVPDEVRESEIEQQHKFSFGEGIWMIVTRVT